MAAETKFASSLAVLTVLLLAAGLGGCASAGLGPDEVVLVLPVGDPDLGEQAFRNFRCGSCHEVAGEPDLKATRRLSQAPTLIRGNEEFSAGRWASAIVAPGHEASFEPAEGRQPTDPLDMPELYDEMTVGELIDLVAFLEHKGEPQI